MFVLKSTQTLQITDGVAANGPLSIAESLQSILQQACVKTPQVHRKPVQPECCAKINFPGMPLKHLLLHFKNAVAHADDVSPPITSRQSYRSTSRRLSKVKALCEPTGNFRAMPLRIGVSCFHAVTNVEQQVQQKVSYTKITL